MAKFTVMAVSSTGKKDKLPKYQKNSNNKQQQQNDQLTIIIKVVKLYVRALVAPMITVYK